MFDKIGYHVLHELVVANSGLHDEHTIIEKILPLYLRKLNCYAAAIFEIENSNQIKAKKTIPKAFIKSDNWAIITKQVEQRTNEENEIYEFKINSNHNYLLTLKNYGYLLLCTSNQFSDFLKNELPGTADNLSKTLSLAKELKNNEEINIRLTKQNAKLKTFTHIVSHNIRSHSSNISGLINLLKETENELERNYFLGLLEAGSLKLEETIRNLNEIITINENTNNQYVSISLKDEVLKTLNILSNNIIKNKINININIDEELKVRVIRPYLESILLNMLSNAVKYRSEKNPSISVNAKIDGDYIIISFEDNGLGIDLNKYGEKLFGMYKTFHNNPDSKGLGLFITKAHIESMGGNVIVESEQNKGTIFHVKLPRDCE